MFIILIGRPTQEVDDRFVNICDYNDAKKTGENVRLFRSLAALAQYSYSSRRICSPNKARAGGVLAALLKPLSKAKQVLV